MKEHMLRHMVGQPSRWEQRGKQAVIVLLWGGPRPLMDFPVRDRTVGKMPRIVCITVEERRFPAP